MTSHDTPARGRFPKHSRHPGPNPGSSSGSPGAGRRSGPARTAAAGANGQGWTPDRVRGDGGGVRGDGLGQASPAGQAGTVSRRTGDAASDKSDSFTRSEAGTGGAGGRRLCQVRPGRVGALRRSACPSRIRRRPLPSCRALRPWRIRWRGSRRNWRARRRSASRPSRRADSPQRRTPPPGPAVPAAGLR